MMTIEMLENFRDLIGIYVDDRRHEITVEDFTGFTRDWDEIIVPIPEELVPVLAELEEQGWKVTYTSWDI